MVKNNLNIWPDWEKSLKDNEETKTLLARIREIEDIEVPDEYKDIWNKVSLEVQKQKAANYRLTEEQTETCLAQLCKRPYYLVSIAAEFGVKNIAEVGTAEGLQYYSFAEYVSGVNGHVWSCDIKDVRNKECVEQYKENSTFCLGDSKKLASTLEEKIDMYYIDAAHDYGDVVRDVVNLKGTQSDNPIWVFDDFDQRFGCYRDIKKLCEMKKAFKVYRVGNAASGNPNHQVIVFGKF
tara:strand:- start:21 stop:731 length:711 start_codon:yes stop_codon:yes gene_type:complete